jgi:hypothetical protein
MATKGTAGLGGDATARATSQEHGDITAALVSFEASLASPSYKRRTWWRMRVRRDLDALIDALRAHRRSAEGVGGLLHELVLRLGNSAQIRRASDGHDYIEKAADALHDLLGRKPHAGNEDLPRKDAEVLTRAIRRHEALEAELLLEAFNRDIGVGD